MSIYTTIYQNLCQQNKLRFEAYNPGSGLHVHHIIPKHSNGSDEPSNITYLTVREHIIAHFLLWKIYKNPNDLRSMHMLGAKLTVEQRRITGIFCRDNKIGFFGADEETRRQWGKKSFESQKLSGDTNSFYWWSTEEGRKKRASLGGKTSMKNGNNKEFAYWMSPEGQLERAKMGGKAMIGMKCIHKDGIRSKVKPTELQQYLDDGWKLGWGSKRFKQKN